MALPKNFCVAPFVQLTTHPSGSFGPCPYLGGTQWKAVKPLIFSHQWASAELDNLRMQFINDEQPEICERCWHEERNGKRSLRKRFWDHETQTTDFFKEISKEVVDQIEYNISEGELGFPTILTIKNGNVCNAKCRTCHPGDSSRWAEDTTKLVDLTGKTYYNIHNSEINWSDDQLAEILHLSIGLKRLELFGGEPLYNKKVIWLLNQLIAKGLAKNITLYINTNGSVNIVEKVPSIKEFARVEIGVSIDGVAEHFNYIRHGLEYSTVIENVKKWQHYFNGHGTEYWIDSISTVDILNVYYLPELRRAVVEELELLPPFWNLLIDPAYLFVKNMPEYVKSKVIEKLSNAGNFDELINTIQQPADYEEWYKFLEITGALDTIREENFAMTFPEFYKIIKD